jgi:hypothetical protein
LLLPNPSLATDSRSWLEQTSLKANVSHELADSPARLTADPQTSAAISKALIAAENRRYWGLVDCQSA